MKLKLVLGILTLIASGVGYSFWNHPASSQASTALPIALVVATCGGSTIYLAGRDAPLTVNTTGQTCGN